MEAKPREIDSDVLSLRAAAQDAPSATALVTDERVWTFADLLEATREANRDLDASALRRAGAREESSQRSVALWGRRSLPSLLRLYALLDEDVGVTMLHPSWTAVAAREAMERAGCFLEVDEGRMDAVGVRVSSGASTSGEATGSGRGVVLFTSGTTGRPKGVVLSRRALIAAADASAQRLGWQRGDRWLLRLPIAHVGGLSIVTRCLAARAAVVLDPSTTFAATSFVERLERTRTTIVSLVPTMLHRLVESRLRPPEHVRLALIGGAAARTDLLRRAAQLGWPTATTYGMTETCSQIATAAPDQWGQAVDHVGRELEGFELRVVDAQSGGVTELGQEGLLEVRGPSLFDGYLGEPARGSDQWFSTGDWARRGCDGNLRVLARRTDMIVTGGENVAPARVEEVLGSHPDVEDVCVVGLDDPEWGQRVAALVVARTSRPPDDSEVEAFLRSRLSRFEMPRRIAWARSLPTMPSGKVDRRAAARQIGEAGPETEV